MWTNFSRKKVGPERIIKANDRFFNAQFKYANNFIKTSKYSLLTFLPLNIFEQFQRLANFYFLCLMILQSLPLISTLSPVTTAIPLFTVLLVTAVKDGYDDIFRHLNDKLVNQRKVEIFSKGKLIEEVWSNVCVGDIICLRNNQFVAADILILSTSESHGLCFIETAELDGETNLKCRQCLPETHRLQHDVGNFDGEIVCEQPNNLLNKFVGVLHWQGKQYSLNNDRIVLRGCVLRNTGWCYGVVIFAGKDSKLMQNSGKTLFKRTYLDCFLNNIIFGIVIFLLTLCFFCACACLYWEHNIGIYFRMYIPWDSVIPSDPVTGSLVIAIVSYFSYIIILSNVVPISLYVSVEMVRLVQSLLINNDEKMYCPINKMYAKARTTTLNEDLGQISYIFSDKTGTLTQNVMTFNKCSIAGVVYGEKAPQPKEKKCKKEVNEVTNFPLWSYFSLPTLLKCFFSGKRTDTTGSPGKIVYENLAWNQYYESDFKFSDAKLMKEVRKLNPEVTKFFHCLALCHTVMAENTEDKLKYQAQSPDEETLVHAARNLGFVFLDRTPHSITIEVMGRVEVHELLVILDFNNERKRMSVILKYKNQITLYCKGSDNVIYERLKHIDKLAETTREHLFMFASDGLRTLCIASRTISQPEYNEWKERHQAVVSSTENQAKRLDEIYDEIETDLELLGATGIEDKLQDGVPEVLRNLGSAGIHIWVLTGDKQETAINIGYSCHLLNDDMEVLVVDGTTMEEVSNQLKHCLSLIHNQMPTMNVPDALVNGLPVECKPVIDTSNIALVIHGHSLIHALHPTLEKLFLIVSTKCRSVICCRVTPLQKANVVQLVKKYKEVVVLAIGDGANDVPMIKAANVGVGISGKEGNQAMLSSDYAIAQFRFLERLLLIHGRWSYFRVCKFLRYFFYKNFTFSMCHFWIAFLNGFSAQSLFDSAYIIGFNVISTALPCLAIGVMDQDVNEYYSLRYPLLYTNGMLNLNFNLGEFWHCALHGLLSASVILLVCYESYYMEITNTGLDYSSTAILGHAIGIILLIVVTVQAGFDTSYWTIFNVLAIILSIGGYFLFYAVFNWVFGIHSLYDTFFLMVEPKFWLSLLLALVLACAPHMIFRFIMQDLFPSLSDRLRLRQRLLGSSDEMRRPSNLEPHHLQYRPSMRSGYAFSHQEGFGRLITSGKMTREEPEKPSSAPEKS
ncbi:unnamed protein product [Bemisia tabaci]|uniref:Phospholipid-transporting ATPase n=1 Tax=Bemisia tabaci TaxID=7038 RepID=A0A9P0A0T0_BEMTA|nr:unnamed protein product [Bemisia tabaci]